MAIVRSNYPTLPEGIQPSIAILRYLYTGTIEAALFLILALMRELVRHGLSLLVQSPDSRYPVDIARLAT